MCHRSSHAPHSFDAFCAQRARDGDAEAFRYIELKLVERAATKKANNTSASGISDAGAGIGVPPAHAAAAPAATTDPTPSPPAAVETIALDIETPITETIPIKIDHDSSPIQPPGCCEAGLVFLYAFLAAVDWAVDEVFDRLPPRRKTLLGTPIERK